MSAIKGVHPYADRWPMLPDDELNELAASIAEHGLREPVILTPDGLILDGRNRARACELAGVEPTTITYQGGDLAEFVIDKNAARRHMSTGARAMASALVLADDGRRQDGRWHYGALQGELTGSGQFRQRLRESGLILDHAPELAEQVVAGEVALDAARKVAEQRRDAERNRLAEEERRKVEETEAREFITANAPDLAALVGGPYETFVEALAVWEKRHREEAARLRAERQEAERREREFLKSMRHTYGRLFRALATLDAHGGDDRSPIMDDFDPAYLDPPQLARHASADALRRARQTLRAVDDYYRTRGKR